MFTTKMYYVLREIRELLRQQNALLREMGKEIQSWKEQDKEYHDATLEKM